MRGHRSTRTLVRPLGGSSFIASKIMPSVRATNSETRTRMARREVISQKQDETDTAIDSDLLEFLTKRCCKQAYAKGFVPEGRQAQRQRSTDVRKNVPWSLPKRSLETRSDGTGHRCRIGSSQTSATKVCTWLGGSRRAQTRPKSPHKGTDGLSGFQAASPEQRHQQKGTTPGGT